MAFKQVAFLTQMVLNNNQMISKLYSNIPRKIKLFLFFLLIILVFYFIGRFIFVRTNNIPSDFLKARQEASVISQIIVNLSSDSAKRIEEISILDSQAQYTEALNLIVSEMNKNREIRQKAIELSSSLETMAKNASDIYPDSSASVALEAIGIETTIISRLINYNDYLNQLLEVLQLKLLGKNNLHKKINELIGRVNEEAKEINKLNEKFNDLMAQFDRK